MLYALLGDLHSDYKKTKAVLKHIKKIAPKAEIIGLGDLYECLIGKKKAAKLSQLLPLKDAVTYKEKFKSLLTFPSIIGNQELRIAQVTGDSRFLQYPEKIEIEHATLLHGHQLPIDDEYRISFPPLSTPLLFFGHSHRAAIYINSVRTAIQYTQPYSVKDGTYQINVGAVVDTLDWCLYDSKKMTVTFYQAPFKKQ